MPHSWIWDIIKYPSNKNGPMAVIRTVYIQWAPPEHSQISRECEKQRIRTPSLLLSTFLLSYKNETKPKNLIFVSIYEDREITAFNFSNPKSLLFSSFYVSIWSNHGPLWLHFLRSDIDLQFLLRSDPLKPCKSRNWNDRRRILRSSEQFRSSFKVREKIFRIKYSSVWFHGLRFLFGFLIRF